MCKPVLLALCIFLELEAILHDKIPDFMAFQKNHYACCGIPFGIWSPFQCLCSCWCVFTSRFCSHLMPSLVSSDLQTADIASHHGGTFLADVLVSLLLLLPSLMPVSPLFVNGPLFSHISVNRE